MLSSSQPPRAPMDRLESIQVLRALAALMVLWLHLQGAVASFLGPSYENPLLIGSSGVDVFFVISGFVICYAAQRERSAARFLAHRAARILPLYWSLTLAIYALALLAPKLLNSTTAELVPLLKSLLFIPYVKDNGLVQPIHMLGWTLNYEVFFYLLFGLGLLVSRSPAPLVCVLLVTLVAVGPHLRDPGVVVRFFTDSLLLEFVYGCLLFLVWRRVPKALEALHWFWPLALVLLIGQNYLDNDLPRAVAQGIPAALLVASLLTLRFRPRGWARPLLAMGDASYSLYLLHPFVIRALELALLRMDLSAAARVSLGLPLMAALSVALALLSYRAFERPTHRWLRRRLDRQLARPAPA